MEIKKYIPVTYSPAEYEKARLVMEEENRVAREKALKRKEIKKIWITIALSSGTTILLRVLEYLWRLLR